MLYQNQLAFCHIRHVVANRNMHQGLVVMDDLLNEFLTETAESIEAVDAQLVTLEQDPNNKAVLDNIFRLVHTIKGTCGFLGLPRLEAVAHASENVLGKFRDGDLKVTPDAVTLILESLDRIKEILAGLEATEAEPEGDDSAIIAKLNAFAAGEAPAAAPSAAPAVIKKTVAAKPLLVEKPVVEADISLPEPLKSDGLRPGEVTLEELEAAFLAAPGPDDEEVTAPANAEAEAPAAEVHAPEPEVAAAAADEGDHKAKVSTESSIANQSIRVNVDVLEGLMNMVSELVLTRNQLLQMLRHNTDSEFAGPLQRLSQCTTELQEGVMKTRMQPIGNAWAKLPRIVRDLSMELKKKIDLQMLGADTELDRQVLELIKDPLTHMVRNSADHGIEPLKDRALAGKPETGTIRLNAFHEGGHIIIEITDDGRGLNVKKLKEKALKLGLASEAELAEMTDTQIQRFIFNAGFSTAEKVTSVSGRGVGMDVVRSNIEKIGGTVDLKSTEGRGTTFLIKIPLTLAIVSALVVKCGTERFAIPQICVLELVRASATSEHKIEHINQTAVLRLRDRLLPLVHLNKMLGLDKVAVPDNETGKGERNVQAASSEDFVVVTQVGNFTFGIVVDQVFDTEEIVVKPVSPLLRNIPIYSGNTILGDGSVIMILDPNGIASKTGNVLDEVDHTAADAVHMISEKVTTESLLVFSVGSGGPKAVPLSLIARLEEIAVEAIEPSEGRHVVQYRGQLMPLVLADGCQQIKESGRQPVLVFTERERSFGLAVAEIVDIVEQQLDVELKSERIGLIGTAVIASKATEVIDVSYYFNKAFSDWHMSSTDKIAVESDEKRILMIDDSSFFQNMLKPLLTSAGYQVTAVASAKDALSLREQGEEFDAIISDIEMPGMDGFDLARAIRLDGAWQEIPLIALSSNVGAKHFARGREVGFTDYVKKFDRAELLAKLSEQISARGHAA
jgi:two-component system chemotaxis sensor kinase CheA